MKVGVVSLRVEERGVWVDGVGHGKLLRSMKLLPDDKIRRLLTAFIQVPEGAWVRTEVKVVVQVLPHGVQSLDSTRRDVEALGHDAGSIRGGASLRAGSTEAREDVFSFVEFEHIHGDFQL